ncbi:hypothetical protein J7E63_04310 [Bacillus sp. ISL-75]|nr:hypothetical protein [Bacillus sp. ISL-75]
MADQGNFNTSFFKKEPIIVTEQKLPLDLAYRFLIIPPSKANFAAVVPDTMWYNKKYLPRPSGCEILIL